MANLVGLAYIAVADGRDDDVPAILDEAESTASGTDAAGITRQIEERNEVYAADPPQPLKVTQETPSGTRVDNWSHTLRVHNNALPRR